MKIKRIGVIAKERGCQFYHMNLIEVVSMGDFRWVVLIYHEEGCGTSRDLEMNTRKSSRTGSICISSELQQPLRCGG